MYKTCFKLVFFFFKDERSWPGLLFLVLFHYGLDDGLQFESYLKLEWKKGDNTDILKPQKSFIWLLFFQQFKKTDESYFFQNFWMIWRSLITHIY